MKKFLKTLIALTLAAVFLFTGCNTTDVSSEISVETSSTVSSVTACDTAFLEEIVLQLGELYNIESWEDAEEIPVYMYLTWYRDYVNSVTPAEKRMERYTSEKYPNGFAYPQEEFEPYVQKYFNVSTEYLRGYDNYYAEDELYFIEGVDITLYHTRPVRLSLTEPVGINGDVLCIPIELSYNGNFLGVGYRTLKVQKTDDGFKYLQCLLRNVKAEFSSFSLLIPSGFTAEGDTVFYNGVEMIKLVDIFPVTELTAVIAQADEEYKKSEFFVSQSEYSSDNVRWTEYTVKLPASDPDGFATTEIYSYYYIEYKNMVIKMWVRPVLYGAGGSMRDSIENILKTIDD